MRTFFSVLGVLLAIALAALSLVMYANTSMVGTADRFLAAVAARDMDMARDLLSDDFKQVATDSELNAFAAALSPSGEAAWTTRDVRFGTGLLEGSLPTESGRDVAVAFDLVRDGTEWRIRALRRTEAGIGRVAGGVPVPGLRESQALVKETTARFAAAVEAKDFSGFYQQSAAVFRERYSLEQFTGLFSGFIEKEVELGVLDRLQPRFTAEPALQATGLLQLQGFFPTRPARAYFAYQYTYGLAGWTLAGIDFKLTTAPGG